MAPVTGVKKKEPIDDKSAKHLFDSIGEKVYKKVHNEDADYRGPLHGHLEQATFEKAPEGQQTPSSPCDLDYEYHTNVTQGYNKENPCLNRSPDRFSYTEGAECDNSKIKDSNGEGGACAPFRRLSLCDQHLEHIDPQKITTHNLLADVCIAAKFEGESIKVYHGKHQLAYPDFKTNICIELARSFADIGDIIRGKDLYRGNNRKRKQLEDNLKNIFEKIYNNLIDDLSKNDGMKVKVTKEEAKKRYGSDSPHFYKLREDWWDANRQQVWDAITCGSAGSTYFRQRACGGKPTDGHCRCNDDKPGEDKANVDPPTFFDYVPQYLRWFEEWAEDFCRKRKHKLENAKKQCRGRNGNEKYCDRYGLDCTKTIYKRSHFVIDNDCTNCLLACDPFRKWMDKQKDQFLKQKELFIKQKEKYQNEISSPVRNKPGISTNYEGYEKHFYDILKDEYKDVEDVNKFLDLLSNESDCQKFIDEGGKIDFKIVDNDFNKNINNKGTFYHSEYCQECPQCGVKYENGTFIKKNENGGDCEGENEEYNCPENVKKHDINFLYSGEGDKGITVKLEQFCSTNGKNDSQDEVWKCCYADSGDSKCKMEKGDAKEKQHRKMMSFNEFFNFWVGHLLNDAAAWRTELTKCLSEDKLKKCEKGCNKNCACFKKWIEKKEKEWKQVKEQFNDQGDLKIFKHYDTLETILEDYYFENIKKAYGELQSIKEMQKMIEENKKKKKEERSKDDVDALDVLFDHELEEAEDCLDIHEDEEEGGGDDECVEESEKIPNNPCSGATHRAMVKNVAADMYRAARQELGRRGGRKALKGNIKEAEFKKKGIGNTLNNVCNITQDHSNANIDTSKNPCNGKATDRFKIGKDWKTGGDINMTVTNAYMPPRRQHICTSNVEHLLPPKGGEFLNVQNGKFNHSFLGDVLLAANYEAKKIKEMYPKNNNKNDNKGICRAIRYSFADIGDIIRGKDMWDNNDANTLQDNLKEIFAKIKGELKDIQTSKYTDNDKYLDLRADWWTANRRQVWRAMKCAIKEGNITKCNGIPMEDYIPQRLRWMTEWAEWYCKYQSQAYDKLENACGTCKGKGQGCTSGEKMCTDCEKQCKEYETKINKWKKQWQPMNIQYITLYGLAQKGSAGKAYPDADNQQMVDFFEQLQKKIKSSALKRPKRSTDRTNTDPTLTSPYFTADRYIHQEIGNVGCNIQTKFCSGGNNYAFEERPPEYKLACGCQSRPAPPKKPEVPPAKVPEVPKEEGKSPCEIIDELFEKPDSLKEACGLKYGPGGKERFTQWYCGGSKSGEKGAICIPPRRRRLYIKKIVDWATKTETESQSQEGGGGKVVGSEVKGGSDGGSNGEVHAQTVSDGENASTSSTSTDNPSQLLRKAFIESAAIETFFLWHRYKKEWDHKNKPQNETLPLGGFGHNDVSVTRTSHRMRHYHGGFGHNDVSAGQGLFSKSRGEMSVATPGIETGGLGPAHTSTVPPPPLGPIPPVLPVPPGLPPGPQIPVRPQPPLLNNGEHATHDNLLNTGKAPGRLGDSSVDNDNPQATLSRGDIPPPFLRQMFYTIADYRDILVGNTPDGIDEVIVSGSSDKTKGDGNRKESDMEKIKTAIEQHLQKQNENNRASGVPKPGQTDNNPTKLRDNWWKNHAPSIWKGMICALTYKENNTEARGQPPVVDEELKKILMKKIESGQDYHYSKVVLKDDDSDTSPMAPGSSSLSGSDSTINNPKLTQFVERPPYFRYLEEWGEEFCFERTKRLKEVKKECEVDDNGSGRKKSQKYSGDGEDCVKIRDQNYDTVPNLEKPSCAKPCTKYRKWIERKRFEFDKQKNAYGKQKEVAQSNSDPKFVQNLSNGYESIKSFLEKLGPCKTNKESGEDKIEFDETSETFKHTKDCDPCSLIGFKCNEGDCSVLTKVKCNRGTINADYIKNEDNFTEPVYMLVSDDNQKEFPEELTSSCAGAGIFEGIRKDVWKCGYFCKSDVCGLKNFTNGIDDKQIILIRALFKRWLEYFFEDYNKIKKKLKPCTKYGNAEEDKCIKGCDQKCKCAEQWVEKKRAEWPIIRNRYIKQYKNDDSEVFEVKSFLEGLQSQIDVTIKKAIGSCPTLDAFQNSTDCAVYANTEKTKSSKKKDVVVCLLDKIQEKAKNCQDHHQNRGEQTEKECQAYSPLPDEEETDENPENMRPNICPPTKQQPEEPEGECKAAESPDEEKKGDEGEQRVPSADTDSPPAGPGEDISPTAPSGDGSSPDPKLNQTEAPKADTKSKTEDAKPPASDEKPRPRPKPTPQVDKNPFNHPYVKPALVTSTLAWSVGIGFVALSYWWLLKVRSMYLYVCVKYKKTKSSVDLLRVLQIPQNDYDIPTLKSSNRYIPYASGKYRGKRYVYIEGDSGTDSGYTDQYSDITSSSESEYEELDINDIYVPGTPKYKTLIEVVLEPSYKNTPSSDIPSDTPSNKFTDKEWNTLKDEFISNMLQNTQNTEPNILHDNVDNNTHPTPSHNKLDQKPFIMSIHDRDRNLLSGEEYNYDMTSNSGNNDLYSGSGLIGDNRDSYSGKNDSLSDNHHPYSGIDLINDALSGNQPIDIYDEILKRKKNELFGTNHVKHTSTHSVSKPTRDDPIHNQINLFHKWLDRHRHMCEKWDKNIKVDILNKLNEEWNKDNNNSGNIPSGENNINKMLNSDVSIQIDMDNPKTTNEFTYVDSNPNLTIPSNPNLVENNINPNHQNQNQVGDTNFVDTPTNPTNVQIEMSVKNTQMMEENYPIGDVWDI
ncbi:erythrocyte membrane protein 1, EMP1 [Plasmodium reichenowi]|uniref:Erythrocyte membrane protein 1, EMP1 n=1 Tax=Plasmodium reichenowi TaxID=5854 RepID=A0A060RVU5_PLARE|nr:erythrocyte membrane protein 1, EMP1 [Plasmodium reichenowi]